MANTHRALTAAAAAAAGLLIAGGAAVADAATGSSASPTAQATSGYTAPATPGGQGGRSDQGAPDQGGSPGQGPDRGQGEQRRAPHQHTAATAEETQQVTAAVKAEDSGVTVQSVQKDPDGSYDVHGTKSGAPVMVEVSKDLKTVEVRTGGPGGHGRGGHGPGGPGGHQDEPATAEQTAQVTAAVQAKDTSVTVTEVRVDPDGSYDAMGTKDGQRVMYDISKDLKTVTERTAPGGMRGPGEQGQPGAPSTGQSSQTAPTGAPASA